MKTRLFPLFFSLRFPAFIPKDFYMDFHFRNLTTLFQPVQIFLVSWFCFSCQNLEHIKQSTREQNSHVFEKNKMSQKEIIKSKLFKKNNSCFQVIDQNYFELQADSAYFKGEDAFFKGNNTEVLKYFKQALLFAPNSVRLRVRTANIYEQEGLSAEALSHYKALLQNSEKNKEIYHRLVDFYALNGLNKKAFEYHQYLLNQDPDNFVLQLKQALLLINQEDWTSALKALKTAEQKAFGLEEKVQVVLSQAYVFAKLQNIPKSLKTMNKLAYLQISEEELVLKIADFYKSLEQNFLALSYLENFQKSQGATKTISNTLLDYYISSENWKKAVRQMELVQALGLFEDHHYFYMAMLLMEKQKHDRALVFLKDLVMKEPNNGQYLYFLALVYEQKQEWQKALKTYNQIQKSSSHFLAANLQSAQLLQQIGRKRESFVLLNKLAFSSNGDISPQALLLYAESLWNSGRKEKALSILTKGLRSKPSHVDLLFLRGVYLKQSGHLNLALRDMRQILKKQDDHDEALNFIASFYSEQKTNLNAAEKMARKALSLKPHSSYFLNTLGWILFQKGKMKSGLHYLKKAFSKNNTDSHIAKRLGKIYLKLKNFKKSDYFFKEALKLEKNDKQLKPPTENVISKQASFMH